jgi:hypothetical protein
MGMYGVDALHTAAPCAAVYGQLSQVPALVSIGQVFVFGACSERARGETDTRGSDARTVRISEAPGSCTQRLTWWLASLASPLFFLIFFSIIILLL